MERILIVDDEKNYLVVLQALLADNGYEMLTAQNGSQALALAAEEEPDLVITDMRMPQMSGLDLIQRLKARFNEMPIIVMTAYGTVENAVEAMKSGATDYITKPFENTELLLTVQKALKMRRLLFQTVCSRKSSRVMARS